MHYSTCKSPTQKSKKEQKNANESLNPTEGRKQDGMATETKKISTPERYGARGGQQEQKGTDLHGRLFRTPPNIGTSLGLKLYLKSKK